MIREENLVLSHAPFAVDLGSFTPGREAERNQGGSTIDAVWFRRQRGAVIAHVGLLWGIQSPPPDGAAEFLARRGSRRRDHHGECDGGHIGRGRWDGSRYLGAADPDMAAAHLEILRPMLAAYPACPDGYQGWWRI